MRKETAMKNKMSKTSLSLLALGTLAIMLVACGETASVPVDVPAGGAPAAAAESAPVLVDEAEPVLEPESAAQGVLPAEEEIREEAPAPEADILQAETPVEAAEGETAISEISFGTLSDDEIAGLLFMREEEKLAHDVYLTLYEQWGQRTFANIASSEATHTDAVKALLDAYGLDDPAAGRGVGDFADPDLQSLYDQLIAQGSESLEAALRVGAAIEEIDILDLEQHIALTDEAEILRVYENLIAGSENHLRAFTSVVERQVGTAYQPDYLSQEAYDLIVTASSGRGYGRD
jgi:hypothetical protein